MRGYRRQPRYLRGQDVHRRNAVRLRRLSRRRGTATDKVSAHDVGAADSKASRQARPSIATCAPLPQRRGADAGLRTTPARRSGRRVRDERARQAPGRRRHARGHLRELSRRPRRPHGQRREVTRVPDQRRNTCAAATRSGAHERLHAPDQAPLPTDQLANYQQSVHYAALTKGNDLSAPTCNDCHGNHGAAPPGAGSVVNVCGTCHAVFAREVCDERARADLRPRLRGVPQQPRRAASRPTRCWAPMPTACAERAQRHR